MSKFNDYEDMYDDYNEESHFTKFRKKENKVKHKGHYSKHGTKKQDFWERAESEDTFPTVSTPIPSRQAPAPANTTYQEAQTYIKGVQIVYNKVSGMKKIDKIYNDQMTYGIKFFFNTGDQPFRIVWFGANQHDRDTTYDNLCCKVTARTVANATK